MLKSIEGVFRNGKIHLLEAPPQTAECRVIVTFLQSSELILAERGLNQSQAENLRHRLESFMDDWQLPEMDVYDEP